MLIPPDNVSLSAFRTEMRDAFDAETTRVEAVNELLDAEITREENMHMLLERRHIGEEEDVRNHGSLAGARTHMVTCRESHTTSIS